MANQKSLNSAFKKAKVSSERPDYKVKPISDKARAKGKETMKKVSKVAKVAKDAAIGALTGGTGLASGLADKVKSKKSMSSKPLMNYNVKTSYKTKSNKSGR